MTSQCWSGRWPPRPTASTIGARMNPIQTSPAASRPGPGGLPPCQSYAMPGRGAMSDLRPLRPAQETEHQKDPDHGPDRQGPEMGPVKAGTVVTRVERILQPPRERVGRGDRGD